MVFSSFPVYLDHPNLQQFQQPDHHHQQGGGAAVDNSGQLPPLPPPPLAVGGSGGGGGSIRPGSIVDRARLANLPLPEAGLKCPRCDSTNTKFCYFNNYSLTQPRHFCKTCRRYWTRGGALRNVPVGGGCRRNKKSKSGGGSKSSSLTGEQRQQMGSNNNSTDTASPSRCSLSDMSGHFAQPSSSSQLPLMAALQSLNHYGGGNLGQTIGGFQAQLVATAGSGSLSSMGFNLGETNLGGNGNGEQWRLPNIGGFEPQTSLFPLIQGEGIVEASSSMLGDHHQQQQVGSMEATSSGVKREENNPASFNLTKQFLVNSSESNQFWGGSPWTGFSGHNSSSTSHLL